MELWWLGMDIDGVRRWLGGQRVAASSADGYSRDAAPRRNREMRKATDETAGNLLSRVGAVKALRTKAREFPRRARAGGLQHGIWRARTPAAGARVMVVRAGR